VPAESYLDAFPAIKDDAGWAVDLIFAEYLLREEQGERPPPLDEFLRRPGNQGAMRHVIVARGDRILGVVRINTGIRLGIADIEKGVTLGDVAQRNFTLVREDDVAFDVIYRLWRRNAVMALVVASTARPRRPHPGDILGVITKEHVADAVAGSLQFYPR